MGLKLLERLYKTMASFVEAETTGGHIADFTINNAIWWYSPALDILQPCHVHEPPYMGAEDWIWVAKTSDMIVTEFGEIITGEN